MGIKKQDFYEGAALFILARTGDLHGIRHEEPFFVLNDNLLIYLKHSTQTRSPWGFTFSKEERETLRAKNASDKIVIGLVCGADGVAALPYESFAEVAGSGDGQFRIACHRKHNEHYCITGPNAQLAKKIAPSNWLKILAQ